MINDPHRSPRSAPAMAAEFRPLASWAWRPCEARAAPLWPRASPERDRSYAVADAACRNAGHGRARSAVRSASFSRGRSAPRTERASAALRAKEHSRGGSRVRRMHQPGLPVTPPSEANFVDIEPWLVSLINATRSARYVVAISPSDRSRTCSDSPLVVSRSTTSAYRLEDDSSEDASQTARR